MRKKHNFMLKRNLLMQVCNWKLKKKSMNCLRMTVCEGRVPYGPFYDSIVLCIARRCMLEIIVC